MATAFQFGDLLIDGLPFSSHSRLDLTVASGGHDAVEPAFFGAPQLGEKALALLLQGSTFDIRRVLEPTLFVIETNQHGIHGLFGQ